MLCPLFYEEVEATFHDSDKLLLIPKIGGISVNRMHFVKDQSAEEIQTICEELEGEFGSFEARLKAAKEYIPSLKAGADCWIDKPILFRSNLKGAKSDLRYDLTYLLKDKSALTHDTALKYFVKGTQAVSKGKDKDHLPFVLETSTLNDQQEETVKQGLNEPLYVVTGPPGTGKTQVVTALISSAVYYKKSVLFSSNNNMPVDGVYERLGQGMSGSGNWMMRLGNQAKREECHITISTLLENLIKTNPQQPVLAQDVQRVFEIERKISEIRTNLKKAQQIQTEIGALVKKEQLIARGLPSRIVEVFTSADPKLLNQPIVRKLKGHSTQGFWLWLRLKILGLDRFKQKHDALLLELIGNDELLAEYKAHLLAEVLDTEAVSKAQESVKILNRHQNWSWCISQRRQLEAQLVKLASGSDLDALKKEKSKLSQGLFDKRWQDGIYNYAQEALGAFNDYYKDIEDYSGGRHKRLEKSLAALKRFFPVWITTNQSAGKIMPPQAGLFDLVVIDEASQCDIPSVIPLLYRAKSAIIIGDPNQFQHITSLRDDIEHTIAKKAGVESIHDGWSFTKRSAFDRAFASASNTAFLKQHYRCHPDIIEFSNQNFYEGKLVAQTPLIQFQNRLPIRESGLIWHNTPGKAVRAQKGAWNPAEVEKTISIFENWAQQGLFSDASLTYGVVTPFTRQVQEMRKALARTAWFKSVEDRFTVGTVHSFQGSECDVLVYSPIVTEELDKYLVNFAASQSDLINVTVTRAKNLLYIVGDLHACQSVPTNTPLYKLATYAEQLRQRQLHPLNEAETAMAAILDDLKLSYSPQYALGNYRLDFMLNAPSGDRYDLEVDGDIHLTAKAVQHDEKRDAFVANRGLRVLRFSARDVMHRPELIKERLKRI
ncbi:MAG: DUF559 domain-containing protein [Proteobacteria bacterium]|nr:DUF559 domain-containing protein [Pseudomonadota bacterium]